MLVTGGAGFIGSHTVDVLLEHDYRVRVLDNLQARVHPNGRPQWLSPKAEFIHGDAADTGDLERALQGVHGVFHLAAYQDYLPEFSKFIHTNTESSALIFELAVSDPLKFPVRKIVFASSQSVCGEGRWVCTGGADILTTPYADQYVRPPHLRKPIVPAPVGVAHGPMAPVGRPVEQLRRGEWELKCPHCGLEMQPLLIDETITNPHTTYGISKFAIELLADRLGRRYGIATASMRYTYVQGSRNSFYNAYSGIARRFAMFIMSGKAPLCYEDGQQLRDYVNVRDVAIANVLVMEKPEANFGIFNVGGGRAITVIEFATMMLDAFGSTLAPVVTGEFRLGDTRHTISDISRMRNLGWTPSMPVEDNVREYVAWIKTQLVSKEFLAEAERVMRQSGVVQAVSVTG
jgi:dTDP-L-rhamnose 4-epimerase